MQISDCRKTADKFGTHTQVGKHSSAFALIKVMGEQAVSLAIAVASKLGQQELISTLLNFQYLKYRALGAQDMLRKKLVLEQKIQMDSLDLSQLEDQPLQNVLRCFQLYKLEKGSILRIKPNKLRNFFKAVKSLVPNFCQGEFTIIKQQDKFLSALIKSSYVKEWNLLKKLAEKARRLTIGLTLLFQSSLLLLLSAGSSKSAPMTYDKKIDVPVLGVWSESIIYRDDGDNSYGDDDRFENMFGEELDLLSDEVENMLINRALNLLYLPRRRYSQDFDKKDDLSVCMAKSGKDGNSKFAELLSKY